MATPFPGVQSRRRSSLNRLMRKAFSCAVIILGVADEAHAHEGWGVAITPDGMVYVTDIPTNSVWAIRGDGKTTRVVRGRHSHALHLDSAGYVYGVHAHVTLPIGSVWRLGPDGKIEDVIPPTTGFAMGLQSFAMDDAGAIYSASRWDARSPSRVLLRRSPDGTITSLAGGPPGHRDGKGSEAGFSGIDGMVFARDGFLYLADGLHVRRVSPDGVVTTIGGRPLTTTAWDEDFLGIAVGSNGIHVADYSRRKIVRVDEQGRTTDVFSSGIFWSPTGVGIHGSTLYVLQHPRLPFAILGDLGIGPYLRVTRVDQGGAAQTLALLWGER